MTFWDSTRKFGERLPVVGGLVQSIFGSPEEEAHQKMMQQAAQAYNQYRPQNIQTRMNAFQNMGNAFAPMNNVMGQLYGQGAQMDMSKLIQNPFPQSMLDQMDTQAYGMRDQSPKALGMVPNPNQTPEEKAQNINAWIPAPHVNTPAVNANEARGTYGQNAFAPQDPRQQVINSRR